MNHNTTITRSWLYFPLVSCLVTLFVVAFLRPALAIDQVSRSDKTKLPIKVDDEFRQVDTANFDYVGGKTRIGVGVDTEFDGTVDISHIFVESDNTATSGDGWVGFDLGGSDKGINEGGIKLNHHWVQRDEQGRAVRVNKVFGAYDRNRNKHDKVTVGYGQEIDVGFWEAYVGHGLSDKRRIGLNQQGQDIFEKSYKYNIGGQLGKFLPDSTVRVRGGLDYAWDNEHGIGEDRPAQLTLLAGVEKFFQGTPHSVSLDVEARRKKGGSDTSETDTRANLSYRYDFGSDEGIYQSGQKFRRVRVEMPASVEKGQTPLAVASLGVGAKRVASQEPKKIQACQLVKSTVELASDTFFEFDKAKLRPSAKQRLNKVVSKIRRSGYLGNIRITGSTCDIGTVAHNQKLSTRRANAVKRYMLAKGFDRNELIARGVGEKNPKYPNKKGSRHKNRRVDLEYVTQNGQCKPSYKTVLAAQPVITPAKNTIKPEVTWKTELISSEPTWVKRALHHNIRHNRRVDTFKTTAGSVLGVVDAGRDVVDLQAVDDSAITAVNTPLTLDVLANDVGVELEIIETGQATNGTVALVNGAVVYTPAAEFIGVDTFTYTVRDRDESQAQGTVTVTVQAGDVVANVAPVLQDDSVGTAINQPIRIDVLANDTDQDGDTLVITSVEQPENGSAEIVNSEVLYTPNQDFSGTNTIRYTVTDGNNHIVSAIATVTVVSNTNTVLVVQDDVVTTPINQAVAIDVVANDIAPEGRVITITGITQPSQGTAVINNGLIVYTPRRDFTGTDTLTYTVSDDGDQVRSATVTIRVIGTANVAPIAQDDSASTTVNQTVTINVIGNDTDPDGDQLTIRSVTQPTNGNVVITNNQLVYTPSQAFIGTDTLTYTITDGNNHVQTASVIIRVEAAAITNTSPIAQDDSAVTLVGQAVTINVVDNDSDADGDTLSIQNVTQPTNGGVTITNNQLLYTPNQGFIGTDTLTYTITDGNNHEGTANVIVSVSSDNNGDSNNLAPTLVDDSVTTIVNQSVTVNVLLNDSDPDGDSLTLTDVTQPSNGRVSISNQQVIYVPDQGYIGMDVLNYTIDDGHDNQRTARLTIRVSPNSSASSNHAPIAQNDQQLANGHSLTIDVLSNDTDADGDSLSITTVGNPSHGSATIVQGHVVYTPETQYTGGDSFSYSITDGKSGSAAAMVNIIAAPSDGATGTMGRVAVNQAPDVNDDYLGNRPANTDILVHPLNNDSDADGDILRIIAIGDSSYGTARNNGDGTISFTPVRDYCGPLTFSYTVSDGHGHTEKAIVHITTE